MLLDGGDEATDEELEEEKLRLTQMLKEKNFE